MKQKKAKTQANSVKAAGDVAGRQRLTFPVCESIASAAAMLGVPAALVSSEKKRGSRAFLTGNRVDTGVLIPDLFKTLLSKNGPILDLNQERARNLRLQNEELERAAKVADRELVVLDEVERDVWENSLLPLKQALDAMPEAVATLANPEQPEHAKKVLGEWSEKMKAAILAKELK